MLSDSDIRRAKDAKPYQHAGKVAFGKIVEPFHEHDDCVRIAYEWLDAQTKIAGASSRFRPLKHIIERWAGRYVSENDVELAAWLHPDIRGRYPYFNLSARYVLPDQARLESIAEAGTQPQYSESHDPKAYHRHENGESIPPTRY